MDETRARALTVLALARDLLSDEGRWVKGWYAVDARGRDADPCASRARRWCAAGALYRVVDGAAIAARGRATAEARGLLMRACPERYVEKFNDAPTTTHADVLALFDRAIELGRGK
jgi:hypothetical protein